jgi:hypothetical protein
VPGDSDLTFRASIHERFGWLIVRLGVGDPAEGRFLDFVISTLAATSAVSVEARNRLLMTGYLSTLPQRPDRFLLREVRISGQLVPDFEVGLSGLAGRAAVDGFLGLNFFRHFVDVRLHVPNLEFTLVDS